MSIRSTLKPPHLAAAAAFGSGLLVHLFGLVNVLHNYDDIAQQPRGYGTGVTSGRWLLSIMGDFCDAIGGNFNLPTVNGLLFLLLIAVSAGLLVSVFRIRNRASAALMGVLFAVFPSAFSTLAFRYTAVYYGVAILLSVAAVWLFQRCSWGFFLSALCIACSLGIYQAYVPITIGMFVLMLLQESLSDDADFRKLLRRSLACCGVLLLGLLLYYVFLKLTLCLYGTQLSDYQGVSSMGKLSLSGIPGLIYEAFYSACMLPVKDYCGLAAMKLIKAAYLLIGLFSGVLLVFLLIKRVRKPSIRLFSLLLCAVFPVAVNFVVIMCPDSWIYTLMVYSLVPDLLCPFDSAESADRGRQETPVAGHREKGRRHYAVRACPLLRLSDQCELYRAVLRQPPGGKLFQLHRHPSADGRRLHAGYGVGIDWGH